ncbi:MAG: O-acetylhomoserine aminocarboxypropyltransferase/cysteine synthase [Trueperaceae bacterium]|nr:O-acetylhomoserine aminocarboxypropyltransferase/cysteine synthase [Trueperaceae bacterium]
MSDYEFDTLQLHAGQEGSDPSTRARAVPIYATSSFTFDDADFAADVFSGKQQGNQYGRMHNPTVQAFTDRLVALEGGTGGVALSSGQAATTTILFSLARPGSNFVVSKELFGGTFAVARKLLEPWGSSFIAVEPSPEAVAAKIDENTVGVWVESIANPSCSVPDIAAIAKLAHAQGVPLIVDNTWGCGGYICQPIALGADIVMHSATKWIGGHGTFIGGAVIDAGSFVWSEERFPAFHKKDPRGKTYLDKGGVAPFAARAYDLGLFTMGMTLSPHSAFLGLQGLETLSLRVQRSCDSALELATWLEKQPVVKRVIYAGLPSHPSHEVAKRTLQHGFGAVISFETQDLETAKSFLDNVKLASHLANIGDAKTVVINPWTTTHASLSEEARRAAGVSPELIRLSVGLESVNDLKQDFAQALTRVKVA